MFIIMKGAPGSGCTSKFLDFAGLLQIRIARAEQILATGKALHIVALRQTYKIQAIFVPGIWDGRTYVSREHTTPVFNSAGP